MPGRHPGVVVADAASPFDINPGFAADYRIDFAANLTGTARRFDQTTLALDPRQNLGQSFTALGSSTLGSCIQVGL